MAKILTVLTLTFLVLLVCSVAIVSKASTANSSGGGLSFGTPVVLGNGYDPNVQSVGNHVYVAWTDKSGGIFFAASSNNGSTWGSPVKIGWGGNYPIVSASGSCVYVVWASAGIMFASSTNYGMAGSWSNPVMISPRDSLTPYIASDSSVVSVVYLQNSHQSNIYGSYVTSSTNNGKTWSNPFRYSNGPEPQVAVSGINVYASADYVDRSHIAFAVSHDSGSTWKVTALPEGSESWLAASGSDVYAVWETKSSQSVIWFMSSSDYGDTTSTKIISTNIPDAWNPMINAQGSNVWVGIQQIGKDQNWLLTSTDGGATWASSIVASGHREGFIFNIATTDGTNLFAMWIQQTGSSSNYAIVAYSGNGGQTWSTASIGQSDPNNDVAIGSISSNGPHGFAAWQYNGHIYFASS